MFVEQRLDARCRFGIFRHHIKVATATGTRQFVAGAEVVDAGTELRHRCRFRTAVEGFVLLPSFADEVAVLGEVAPLQHIEHLHGMMLHLVEQCQMACAVEEHPSHDFGQNVLRRTRQSGVVEQVAGTVFGCAENGVGQPACHGRLVKTGGRL